MTCTMTLPFSAPALPAAFVGRASSLPFAPPVPPSLVRPVAPAFGVKAATGQATSNDSSGLEDFDFNFADLLGMNPALAMINDAFQQGLTPEQFVNGLSPEVLISIAAACTVVSALLGKWKAPVGIFASVVCTVLNGALAAGAKPDGTPLPKPPSCPAGQVFFPEFNTCGDPNVLTPCANGLGFVSPEKSDDGKPICVRCPPGFWFASREQGCIEGCPPGMSHVPGHGCVDPSFNTPCTPPGGGKGVHNEMGQCVQDGCPEGSVFDLVKMDCVPNGTQVQAPPPKENPPTNEKKDEGMSTTKKVLVGLAGVSALVGLGFAAKAMMAPSSTALATTG